MSTTGATCVDNAVMDGWRSSLELLCTCRSDGQVDQGGQLFENGIVVQ